MSQFDSDNERFGFTGQTILGALLVLNIVSLAISLSAGYLFESILLIIGIVGIGYSIYDRRLLVGIAAAVVWFITGFIFWAPAFQETVYLLVIQNPGGLQWLFVGILLTLSGGIVGYIRDERGWASSVLAVSGIVIAVIGFFVVGPYLGNMYAQEHIANDVNASAQRIDDLPESVENRSRIAPQAVAKNWASNSLQYPQYTLAGGDITYINGTPYWSYSLSPNGIYNTWTKKQIGGVYVNQSSVNKDIMIDDNSTFKYGQGMALTDSYEWELARRDYFKDYKDSFVLPTDRGSKLAVPYTVHEWEFRLTPIPQLYSVPKFGGVKVIDNSGEISDYSPEEAQNSEILGETQNYYPYQLAKYKVQSMAYKNGILNVWFGHKEQLEVASVPGQGNSQPFTVPTDEGIKYFVAAEPWGDANGIYQVWVIDAQTGEMSVKQLPKNSAFRGPRKAIDSITSEPTINRLTDANAVEPIPIVKDGTLFWQVRIVPSSSARIQYIAFFNAETEDVTIVETTREVRAFLSDGQNPDTVSGENDGNNTSQDEDCSFYVNIDSNGDGDLNDPNDRQICVPSDGEVSVERGNSTQD